MELLFTEILKKIVKKDEKYNLGNKIKAFLLYS